MNNKTHCPIRLKHTAQKSGKPAQEPLALCDCNERKLEAHVGFSVGLFNERKKTEPGSNVGMVDNGDLKSPARRSVRVRVPLRA